jgi:hypothetical protein
MLFRVVLALVAVLTGSGCMSYAARRANLSAPHTGCVPDELTIEKTGDTWIATCHGQAFVCGVGLDDEVACTARRAAPVAATAPRTIERVRVREQVVLRAHVEVAGTRFVFVATPAEATRVWVAATIQGDGRRGACEGAIVADGTVHALTRDHYEYVVRSEKLRFALPFAALEAIASATIAEVRVCDEAWPLGADDLALLRVLAARAREESARTPQTSPAPRASGAANAD